MKKPLTARQRHFNEAAKICESVPLEEMYLPNSIGGKALEGLLRSIHRTLAQTLREAVGK